MRYSILWSSAVWGCVASCAGDPAEKLGQVKLPAGFAIELYARVPGARSLAVGKAGTVFVGTREDKVYAIRDNNGDQRGEEVIVIAEGLNQPNGVAVRGGDLYVAEISRVIRFRGIEERLRNPPAAEVVNEGFPTDKHYGWKFIAFGPEGKLYVPVGMPCNICNPADPRYGSIMRMDGDGKNLEIFARGIRNTVGFDWQPETRVLWFTENGRDWQGDDSPPDELDRAPRAGLHFGFPYVSGKKAEPEYGKQKPADLELTPPALELGPHVAALGMRFYTGKIFPAEYQGQIFIAEHGSWNRTHKIGYRVMLVRMKGEQAASYEPFATGWLEGESAWGRPVDVQVMPDGALLVSDDQAGAVYRISYKPQ